MAARKTLKFLPSIFQTDTNDKFLSATLDQLIAEPNLKTINGYIGRKFAPTYKHNDSYIIENTADRQNYQLEPSVVVRGEQQDITFFSSYIDLLNKISYYGGLIDNHSRLFDNEYYSFNPHISFDKFVNFSQYYWLENGPDPVQVNTSGVELTKTFKVIRDVATGKYSFESDGEINNTLILARGGQYTFEVDQPGVPFWIQTEPGVDGKINATPTISSRNVLGVTNNGNDVGTVFFAVPQSNSQDRYLKMNIVANVDYAAPLAYADLQGKTLSEFLTEFPEYQGITGTLDGKTLVFIDQETLTNRGEAAWTYNNVVVPYDQRYGVWRVQFSDGSSADPVVRLIPVQNIALNEKVYIRYGLTNANTEFFKDRDGFLHQVPVISSVQDTIYFQDGVVSAIYGTVKIVEYSNWSIDVENDIIGKMTYTSPNGVKFTSGLKVKFDADVTPVAYQNKEFYVENVGDSIRLVDVELLVVPEAYQTELTINYPESVFPDYITINRAHPDLNGWSRRNRWFHRDVIIQTAGYNNTPLTFDQSLRSQRPIIQFEGSLQLFNSGRSGKRQIDILDSSITDAFNQLEGKTIDSAFGVTIVDGMRVLFSADTDPLVRDRIYVINLVQFELDDGTGPLPTPTTRIKLTIAEDGDNSPFDTVAVTQGFYKGTQWWYNGTSWIESQEKTSLQQFPLFDIFDNNNQSISTYNRSTFAGTYLFGYKKNNAGVNDTVLGFPLTYRNFGTQGDIEFQNFYNTDTFSYYVEQDNFVKNISAGFLHKIVNSDTVTPVNIWQPVVEESKQYQILTFSYTDSNQFKLDIAPESEQTIPYLKVYVNNALQNVDLWSFDSATGILTILPTLTVDSKIDVLIYSKQVSPTGSFSIPVNLDLNAQNLNLETVTLGQLRNHLVALSQNSKEITGNVLSANNLRDIEIKQQGGNILQHSAPTPYASLFLVNDDTNFIDSVRYAQREYTKFKNKFLELSASLPGINPTDPRASVDLILSEINKNKNSTFPWYYSDMLPNGPLTNIVNGSGYTVFDPLVRSYEITNVFSSTTLSNLAVLVYLNGVQLTLGNDYIFETDRPAVQFLANVELNIDDIIVIVEYLNTDGSYIPETPSKLGLYPKFVPEIYLDTTYRTPVNVLRGHDGSIMPAFNDYRDDFLLEFEKRIYNNIKLPETIVFDQLSALMPGKFRNNDYSITEANSIISRSFLSWIGNNRIDFSTNDTFQSNDAFTWNYSRFNDRLDGEPLQGSWRACFRYFYDTDEPHVRPWQMLGFSNKPDWWEDYYGPAPYTGGNQLLWDDLEAGRIMSGPRQGIDVRYARPGLSNIIPVDENGNLISPAGMLVDGFNSSRAATAWAVGEWGPTETAWRRSSDYPFAIQQALAVAKPGKYFGLNINTYSYRKNEVLGQYLDVNNYHLTQTNIPINGDLTSGVAVRAAGYVNWVADYLRNRGIDPVAKLQALLSYYDVNLAYKMAGFTDQTYIQVLAEQSSPSSTNDSIVVPTENYNVHLYKSTPVDRIVYSGVIVEKTTNGFTVRGYDLLNPYFTIIPSIINANATKITVLNTDAVVYRDYQLVKLSVPYGYEFKSRQQIVDFLISYERFLIAQGFVFADIDDQLAEIRNWQLSAKEFLFWAQQGWAPGSILVLSPIGESINAITNGAIADMIADDQYGTKVLDQNFKLVKRNDYNVLRSPTNFKLTLTNTQIIGLIEINLVQYEHVLVFDNTTVFNDVIYKPELGNRQYRLKLIGQKTGAWDGSISAPGFIHNSGNTDSWQGGKDYLRGDLVQYKNRYYVAMDNIAATETFNFASWKEADYGKIKRGLLSNFSTIGVNAQSYYNPYGYFNDAEQIKFSHGLIGFKPRGYLDDLGINETSQIEFYKGYIKQKGSANAFDALTNAQFNNLNSTIAYYEEWAVRVGEYGALDINPYVEIALDEKAFSVNPAIAEFVGADRSNEADGINIFNKNQIYKSTEQYTGTIALTRNETSDYNNDIPTAGYVNIDDVDTTMFDINDFSTLNVSLDSIGSGYTIWVAKDFTQQWNVYRVTETDVDVVEVSNSMDGYITFKTNNVHNLTTNNVFMVRNFDPAFDGFYQVYRIENIDTITVQYAGDVTELTTLEGRGTLFTLDSIRFTYMEDARKYMPPHGWKAGEKIWIDIDAATSTVQGQPVDTENNTWKVYEKTMPWTTKQSLPKAAADYVSNDGFGKSLKISGDGVLTVVGSPESTPSGKVYAYTKQVDDTFSFSTSIAPDGNLTAKFGQSVEIAGNNVAVGAPDSNNGNGFVYIYNKPEGISAFLRSQILTGNLTLTEKFGSSISFDETGDWLYVGAPESDSVYVFGLNKNVEEQEQTTSINNQYLLELSGGTLTANAGDRLRQLSTGATTIILESVVDSDTVIVSTTENIAEGAGNTLDLLTVDEYGFATTIVPLDVYPTLILETRTIDSIELTFTPAIANDANSILITDRARTYIPNVDYTLSGTTVQFNELLAPNDIAIKQGPYYTLVTTLHGAAGSEFGYCLDSSYDSAQLAVGAPGDTVNGKSEAGAVYVYDRVIESFNSISDAVEGSAGREYTTSTPMVLPGNPGAVYRVTVDGVEVTNYSLVDQYTIRFADRPADGRIIYVETNQYNLLEKLVGVSTLDNDPSTIQTSARFGTSLTICSNNCAIYVGAPYYDNGTTYNTGAVWKFHNRGRLYGTNTGSIHNPTFTIGDTIRLDNFEVPVTGRLMPTVGGNILTLSSNIVASAGEYITQSLSSANVRVVTSTPATGSNHIVVSSDFDGASTTFAYGAGNVVIVSNLITSSSTVTTAYPKASLDSFVQDVNQAGIIGVSAVNQGGYLRIDSDKTVAKNLLRILSGAGTVYQDAGMNVFAFMQIILNPYNTTNEYFGSKVILAANAYMLVISSERGTTKKYTTFDRDTTVLDNTTTGLFDSIKNSGSVYVYELYDDPRDAVEDPGRYAFAQQLNPGNLITGDQFGYAIDIVGSQIIASAPSDDTVQVDAGSVYVFTNPTGRRGWSLIRHQQPKVDVDSINRIFLYDQASNTIVANLEFIDPAKGKIPGQAEQEISYKTAYDPAKYNQGSISTVTIDSNMYWGENQVGQVWWDLNNVRFIDYEQDSLTYRSINWGQLFPSSTIDIAEWVESSVPPSQYVDNGGLGVPKYSDNGAYVESIFVDPLTNIVTSKYFFWVVEKTSVDAGLTGRKMPIASIASLIRNPKSSGIAYAAIIQNNAIIIYNASNYLTANNTILHIDYELIRNDSIIHSEYELIQKGNADSYIPAKIVNKLIDSLAGIDVIGAVVPDPKLSVADQLGIGSRPRQSMFVDRVGAVNDMVEYVNSVLIKKPVARQYDLTTLNSQEPLPNIKLGEYDRSIPTEESLKYIDTSDLPVGYKILVENDTTQSGLWVLYTLDSAGNWVVGRIQSYKTSLYWEFVDWYADGYGPTVQIDYAVSDLTEALKLQAPTGSEILVKVNYFDRGWNLLVVNEQGTFDVVGVENGTIQLKTTLGDFVNNGLGYSNQGFDNNRYDENAGAELRKIIEALRDDIFISELSDEFNKLFFVMINYLFGEQKYVDWIFKTSFISVVHQLRELGQTPSYIKDNQTYYQEYLTEVKPYSTKIREYLIGYNSIDNYNGSVTDFDLPPYYDTDSKIFRSPSGEFVEKDEALWQTDTYKDWYDNRTYTVGSIIIDNPGSGYISEPIVTIVGGGSGAIPATARAVIDYDTGALVRIDLISAGSGYFTTPTVIINGSSEVSASAYAVLYNGRVRSLATTMKFDRISYTSNIVDWQANTAYTAGTIVSYNGAGYVVNSTEVSGSSFISDNYTIAPANVFATANDRIMAYYAPTSAMPAKDLKQLISGIDYPGVQLSSPGFDYQPGFAGAANFDITLFDNIEYDEEGNPTLSENEVDSVIKSTYLDSMLGLRPEDINVDGGLYVDRYSSHAPEELIPGLMSDSLNLQLFTRIDNDPTQVAAYRAFHRTTKLFNKDVRYTEYSRIADANSTLLAAPLYITDTEISVVNATALNYPNPTARIPGVVFIDGERITYWELDRPNNKVKRIRRGTLGTSTPVVHNAGRPVVDGGLDQRIPGIAFGNVTVGAGNNIVVSETLSYTLTLSGNVEIIDGDFITQDSGANLTVRGTIEAAVNTFQVVYNDGVIVPGEPIYINGEMAIPAISPVSIEQQGFLGNTGYDAGNLSVNVYLGASIKYATITSDIDLYTVTGLFELVGSSGTGESDAAVFLRDKLGGSISMLITPKDLVSEIWLNIVTENNARIVED